MDCISQLKRDFLSSPPKICVPIVESGLPAIFNEIKQINSLPIDLVEWRMDYFFDDPISALPSIANEIEKLLLLCTLRSEREGGQAAGSNDELADVLEKTIESGLCQLIDIELSLGEKIVKRLINTARNNCVLTVLSKHNFNETPTKEEMIQTFQVMHKLGADLCKYAVMPRTPWDVLALLEASLTASESFGPVVAIAMGELGKISRVCGNYFGSCMTFAVGKNSSAPGQLPAEELYAILQDLAIKK